MNYITFTFKDPDTLLLKCVGVKYKTDFFSDTDMAKLLKNGTANQDVRNWLKELRREDKLPIVEILYQGTSSVDACFIKQQILINAALNNTDLIGHQPLVKQYTKKVRNNQNMRRAIIDQYGNTYSGILDAGEKLLLAPSNISKVLHNKLDHIGGYKFSFI
jgi:hypothetical protein